jgi:hypothetical protein
LGRQHAGDLSKNPFHLVDLLSPFLLMARDSNALLISGWISGVKMASVSERRPSNIMSSTDPETAMLARLIEKAGEGFRAPLRRERHFIERVASEKSCLEEIFYARGDFYPQQRALVYETENNRE